MDKTNSIFASLDFSIQVFHPGNFDPPRCSHTAHQNSLVVNDYLCSLNSHNVAVKILVSNGQNGATTEINAKLVLASILSEDEQEVWLPARTAIFVLLSCQSWVPMLYCKKVQHNTVRPQRLAVQTVRVAVPPDPTSLWVTYNKSSYSLRNCLHCFLVSRNPLITVATI